MYRQYDGNAVQQQLQVDSIRDHLHITSSLLSSNVIFWHIHGRVVIFSNVGVILCVSYNVNMSFLTRVNINSSKFEIFFNIQIIVRVVVKA